MIITIKPDASDEAVGRVTDLIESKGLTARLSEDSQVIIVGMVDDRTKFLDTNIEISEDVNKVVAVAESYKLVNKKFHPEDSVVPVGSTHIGPGTMTVMAGPYAIESLDQLLETAYVVKKTGATLPCGSVYRPRTSPYPFQGLEEEGFKYMKAAREATGLNVICEIASAHTIESVVRYVDMLQTGTRNVQNFELLKEIGGSGALVSLERGLCATTDEWLNTAERTISEGNPNIVLCERGIRAYEASTKNTPDVSAVPIIRQRSHLPTTVDPSHVTGIRAYMELLAEIAIAVGAGGPMIEVHPYPAKTLSDGSQSLTFDAFEQLMKNLVPYAELSGRASKVQ